MKPYQSWHPCATWSTRKEEILVETGPPERAPKEQGAAEKVEIGTR